MVIGELTSRLSVVSPTVCPVMLGWKEMMSSPSAGFASA
jgi:hypothetical protein